MAIRVAVAQARRARIALPLAVPESDCRGRTRGMPQDRILQNGL
jgi:hypothetical protein